MLKKLTAVIPGEPQTLFPVWFLSWWVGRREKRSLAFLLRRAHAGWFCPCVFPFVTQGNPGYVMAAGTTCGMSAKEKSRTFVRLRTRVSTRCFLDWLFDLYPSMYPFSAVPFPTLLLILGQRRSYLQ